MKIMFFLVKRAPASVLIVCIFSILSGISSAALVGLINDSLSDFNEDSVPAVAYFIGLLLGVFMLQMASEYMDINTRLDILNKKLSVVHELYEILSNELKHAHSSFLEMIIIGLIVIEVVLTLFKDILKWL